MIDPFEEVEKIASSFDSLNDHDKQLVSSAASAGFIAWQNYQKEVDELSFEYTLGKQVREALELKLNVSVSKKTDSNCITIDFTKAWYVESR